MKLEINNPTKEQILSLYNSGIPFSGFRGGFIVDASVFASEVPLNFPNRVDEDGNVKTYSQYTRCVSLGGYNFVYLGSRSSNGNRKDAVSAEEFSLWVDALGLENLYTEGEALALRDSLIENTEGEL